jgi:hypothetical protein
MLRDRGAADFYQNPLTLTRTISPWWATTRAGRDCRDTLVVKAPYQLRYRIAALPSYRLCCRREGRAVSNCSQGFGAGNATGWCTSGTRNALQPMVFIVGQWAKGMLLSSTHRPLQRA